MARVDELFKGTRYRLEPDYERPLLEVPEAVVERMRARLELLYGAEQVEWTWRQLERVMRVHHAHSTEEIEAAEAAFDPEDRFTEHDVMLITYGDLILSDDRSPLKTLADCVEKYFRGIITSIHILPFYPYSSDRGFSVVSFKAVDPQLGTWSDVAEIEDDFKLMFDGVFNHVSSKSRWFQEFLAGNPDFEDVFTVFSTSDAVGPDHLKLILRPRTSSLLTQYQTIDGPRWVWTTFSPDQIDLNFKNPRVLLKILEVLLFYVRHGADLLRLDAITYLWFDLGTSCAHLRQTHEVVKLFRDVLDVVAPHVGLVTETNVPHADNITYFGDGTDEAQMVYNFALPPLVLQAFQTGDASVLSSWASDLEPPSKTTAFFNFLDSHDGIGVMGARGILSEEQIDDMCRRVKEHGGYVSEKADGDGGTSPYELNITWFSALNRKGADESSELKVRRFIASRAVALVLRGVPGIYLPSMIGHHNDLEAVVREGSLRSINRTRIVERRLFRLLHDERGVPARIARSFLDLLEARVGQRAFHPNAAQRVLNLDPRLFSVVRIAREGDSAVLCLINVSGDQVAVSLSRSEAGIGADTLTDLIDGGTIDAGDDLNLTLEPYAIRWLLGHPA